MFFGAIAARRAEIGASSLWLGHFMDMAVIEVFVLHFRNLAAFLYPDAFQSAKDDVLAHHFFGGSDPFKAWVRVRPRLTATVKRAKGRADKEIAHLTAKRVAGARPGKEWDFVGLGDEIRTVLRAFIGGADPLRLAPSVGAAIPPGAL